MKTVIYLTLVHSLWLGLLLAALTALILLFTRSSSAVLRYRLFTGSLMLFAAGIAATATAAIKAVIYTPWKGNVLETVVPALSPLTPSATVGHTWAASVTLFSTYDAYLVGFWFIVACLKSVQLGFGLHRVHYMRHNNIYDAGAMWQERVSALSSKLGITQKVRIMQSGLTQVPIVLGHLKPLILLPLALISSLSQQQVEAIICHELAHIKRNDYLVNLLQSFMDIVFFFNPAVLWLNTLIRKEREHCCDEMVLAANVDVNDYVNAMVSCSEFQLSSNGYAMAFFGSKSHLMQRISRIIEKRKSRINRTGKILLLLLVVATGTMAVTLSRFGGSGTHVMTIREETPTRFTEIKAIDIEDEIVDMKGPVTPVDKAEMDTLDEHIAPVEPMFNPVADYKEDCRALPVSNRIDSAKSDFSSQDAHDMINELRTDGIISNSINTYYQIDDHQLIVNNVKQPEAVRKKYFSKYLKFNGRSVCYRSTSKEG